MDDLPHDVLINAEVVMDQAITKTCHWTPFDLGISKLEVRWNSFCRLADNGQASGERPLERLVLEVPLPSQPCRCIDQVRGLDENVGNEITRLVGHPWPPPECGGP